MIILFNTYFLMNHSTTVSNIYYFSSLFFFVLLFDIKQIDNQFADGLITTDILSMVYVYSSLFENNFCFANGGVIEAYGFVEVSGCTFIGNTALLVCTLTASLFLFSCGPSLSIRFHSATYFSPLGIMISCHKTNLTTNSLSAMCSHYT